MRLIWIVGVERLAHSTVILIPRYEIQHFMTRDAGS